ncbi:hypothetical protein V8C35DRAFT_276199 [Trichoderma chlorosporum]
MSESNDLYFKGPQTIKGLVKCGGNIIITEGHVIFEECISAEGKIIIQEGGELSCTNTMADQGMVVEGKLHAKNKATLKGPVTVTGSVSGRDSEILGDLYIYGKLMSDGKVKVWGKVYYGPGSAVSTNLQEMGVNSGLLRSQRD